VGSAAGAAAFGAAAAVAGGGAAMTTTDGSGSGGGGQTGQKSVEAAGDQWVRCAGVLLEATLPPPPPQALSSPSPPPLVPRRLTFQVPCWETIPATHPSTHSPRSLSLLLAASGSSSSKQEAAPSKQATEKTGWDGEEEGDTAGATAASDEAVQVSPLPSPPLPLPLSTGCSELLVQLPRGSLVLRPCPTPPSYSDPTSYARKRNGNGNGKQPPDASSSSSSPSQAQVSNRFAAPLNGLLVGGLQPLLLELELGPDDEFLDAKLEVALAHPGSAPPPPPPPTNFTAAQHQLKGPPTTTSSPSPSSSTLPAASALAALAALPSTHPTTRQQLALPFSNSGGDGVDSLTDEAAAKAFSNARAAAATVAESWGDFFWTTNDDDPAGRSNGNGKTAKDTAGNVGKKEVEEANEEAKESGGGALFRPLKLGSDGQPSEFIVLSPTLLSKKAPLEAKADDKDDGGAEGGPRRTLSRRRLAVVPLWVKPSKEGTVCVCVRVSFRPRADHSHVVAELFAFEVRCVNPFCVDMALLPGSSSPPAAAAAIPNPFSSSFPPHVRRPTLATRGGGRCGRLTRTYPLGVGGALDLADEPTFQRKALEMSQQQEAVASKQESAESAESAAASYGATSLGSLGSLIPASSSSPLSSPPPPAQAFPQVASSSSRVAAEAAAAVATAVVVVAGRQGACTVTVTNRHSQQPIVLHKILFFAEPNEKRKKLTLLNPEHGSEEVAAAAAAAESLPIVLFPHPATASALAVSSSFGGASKVTLHFGNAYSARFTFQAPAAATAAAAAAASASFTGKSGEDLKEEEGEEEEEEGEEGRKAAVTYHTASLHPAQAAPLGRVVVYWTRACDDNACDDIAEGDTEGNAQGSAEGSAERSGGVVSHGDEVNDEDELEQEEEESWHPPESVQKATAVALRTQTLEQQQPSATVQQLALLSEASVECPRVLAVHPPFDALKQRPGAAVVGEPLAVSWVLTNNTSDFQTLLLRASLPPPPLATPNNNPSSTLPTSSSSSLPALSAASASTSPLSSSSSSSSSLSASSSSSLRPVHGSGGGAACFAHLATDGKWVPYPPSTNARVWAALKASPRGGRVSLLPHALNNNLAAAADGGVGGGGDGGDAASSSSLSQDSSSGSGWPPPPTAALEIRWGTEGSTALKGLALGLPSTHPTDSNIVQVNLATGNARAVRQLQLQLQEEPHTWGGGGSGPASASAFSNQAEQPSLRSSLAASSECANSGGSKGDSFLWSGLRSGSLSLAPGASATVKHTLVPLRPGRLPLPQLDAFVANLLPTAATAEGGGAATTTAAAAGTGLVGGGGGGGGGAYVLFESAAPPELIFVAPLNGQLSSGLLGSPSQRESSASASTP